MYAMTQHLKRSMKRNADIFLLCGNLQDGVYVKKFYKINNKSWGKDNIIKMCMS